MKVSELLELLKGASHDAEVILQRDSEGNGYSPLYEVDCNAIYRSHSNYSGDVYDPEWSAEDACFEPDAWARFIANSPRCVVMAPTN